MWWFKMNTIFNLWQVFILLNLLIMWFLIPFGVDIESYRLFFGLGIGGAIANCIGLLIFGVGRSQNDN